MIPLSLLRRIIERRGGRFSPLQRVAMDALPLHNRHFPFPIVGIMEHLFRKRRQSNVDRVATTPTNPNPANVMGMPDTEWNRMMQLRNQRGDGNV